MLNEENQENTEKGVAISNKIFPFLIVGSALITVGIIVIAFAATVNGDGSASASAVIFIGPFPLVFGSGPDATLLIAFGIILAVMSIVIFLVANRQLTFNG